MGDAILHRPLPLNFLLKPLVWWFWIFSRETVEALMRLDLDGRQMVGLAGYFAFLIAVAQYAR